MVSAVSLLSVTISHKFLSTLANRIGQDHFSWMFNLTQFVDSLRKGLAGQAIEN